MKLLPAIILACGLAALPVAVIKHQAQEGLWGVPKIIDGDSIILGDWRIRLAYIDAPEIKQECRAPNGDNWPCGEVAKLELIRIVGNKSVTCEQVDVDRYGRVVAICRAGETDIGAAMVRHGYAIAYERYSTRYVDDQNAARLLKKGIWQSEFTVPEVWRMQHRGQR